MTRFIVTRAIKENEDTSNKDLRNLSGEIEWRHTNALVYIKSISLFFVYICIALLIVLHKRRQLYYLFNPILLTQ